MRKITRLLAGSGNPIPEPRADEKPLLHQTTAWQNVVVAILLSAGSCDLDDSRRHDGDDDACDDALFCRNQSLILKQKPRRGKALSLYRTGAEIFSKRDAKNNFAEMTVYMQPFDTEVATRMTPVIWKGCKNTIRL